MDLAKIKPRWTVKHEFKVELPKNSQLDETMLDQMEEEDIDNNREEPLPSLVTTADKLSFAAGFQKTVLDEFEG